MLRLGSCWRYFCLLVLGLAALLSVSRLIMIAHFQPQSDGLRIVQEGEGFPFAAKFDLLDKNV
ncbi:MAG: hypothetical protein RIG27_02225 [Coleofasciculus sp. F4-SAH-05]|jgi:hypothetical protein